MSDAKPEDTYEPPNDGRSCVVSMLRMVPLGRVVAFEAASHGCRVGGYFLGFSDEAPEGTEAYLGDKGQGLKMSPELVKAHLDYSRPFPRQEKYCLVGRLDTIAQEIEPEVVFVLGDADSLSGLLMLANFDREGTDNVIAPFATGCCSVINEPLKEALTPEPRAVIGLFDVTVRHLVDPDILSFAVPYRRLLEMLANMDNSFVRQAYWRKLRGRKRTIRKAGSQRKP